ncbi:Uncharacterised protein [Vibrio cholerae]|nr:Uncharacterised protein [Vibrio cholerae]
MPQPLGPIRLTISPSAIVKLNSAKRQWPSCLRMARFSRENIMKYRCQLCCSVAVNLHTSEKQSY